MTVAAEWALALATAGRPEEIAARVAALAERRQAGVADAGGTAGLYFTLPIRRGQERLALFWQGPPEQAEEARRAVEDEGLVALDEPCRLPAALLPPSHFEGQAEIRATLFAIFAGTGRQLARKWKNTPQPTAGQRLRAYLHLLVAGLGEVGGGRDSRVAYLRHHRNSLLRDLLLRTGLSHPKLAQILERYDREAAPWRPGGLQQLRRLIESPPQGDTAIDDELAGWSAQLRRLAELAAAQPSPSDPYAALPLHGLLTQVFHHAAAQAGLRQLDEGLGLHLLLLAHQGTAEELDCPLLPPPLRHTERELGHEPGIFDFENGYLWLALVAAASDQGREWAVSHPAKVGSISATVREGLFQLRRKRLAEGEALLLAAKAALDAMDPEDHASARVVTRFYFGSLAFLRFSQGDFEGAWQALDDAAAAVAEAVERHPFLIPFALVSLDIPLKKARLARDLHRWGELCRELEILHGGLLGGRPLLAAGGFELRFADLVSACAELPENEELGPSLRYLRDTDFRQRHYLQLAGNLCHPYPLFLGDLR